MSAKPFITVTGIDVMTDIGMLPGLDAEIGILYSANPEGRARYPKREWIVETARNLPRVSIHVCGSKARNELLLGQLDDLVENAQRIQINGVVKMIEVRRVCERYPAKTIITQHGHPENKFIVLVESLNHALLVDGSGGRGISPKEWNAPQTKKQIGFAGGLSASGLGYELGRIRRTAFDFGWIDAESKLRINDRFSILLAVQMVNRFHELMKENG